MKQTRSHSLLEATTNTVVGLLISYALTYFCLPIWDIKPSHGDAFQITAMFTAASLIRGYVVRRIFNGVKE